MKLTTTFALLKENDECNSIYLALDKKLGGMEKYGQNTEITILTIYETLNFDDALWSLRAVPKEQKAYCDKFCRLLNEKKYPTDKRPRKAVEVARLGTATIEETANYIVERKRQEKIFVKRLSEGAYDE